MKEVLIGMRRSSIRVALDCVVTYLSIRGPLTFSMIVLRSAYILDRQLRLLYQDTFEVTYGTRIHTF